MDYHKLLKRQLNKYLPNAPFGDKAFETFLNVINESYQSFEKDLEFSNHAFIISEKEYNIINLKYIEEAEAKKISIEKLKETLQHIDESFDANASDDDIVNISEYIKQQVTNRKKIEVELKKNVKRVNALITNLHTGVLIENEERQIVFSNQSFCKLFNIALKPTQLIGNDSLETTQKLKYLFLEPDSFISRIDELLKNKLLVIGDVLQLKDGRVLERDFVPLFVNGNYSGHFWNYTNVTEKNKIANSLSESEARNRLIMNSALDAIIAIDDKGLITFWNPQAEKLFGWTETEVVNQPLSKIIIPNRHRVAHEMGMTHFMKTGDGPVLQKLIELPALNKNGTEFPVELSITPVKIGDSTIFCSFIRDISERKKIEKTLATSEEKYRSIIANMNLGLLEVDKDEVIQYANQSFCDMCGYELDEILNKKATDLFVRGDNNEMMNEKISLRTKGISDAYEIITKNKRGEVKCWLVSGAPRYNNEGEIVGSIGIHLDVTDQKEIEFQLVSARESAEQSAQAKEAFLANMSHEIRTPLNGIIGMIRELGKENLSGKQKSYLDSAQKASRHLLSIINNILDFSKIEAGELKLLQYHFSLFDEINDVVHILSNQANEKGILLSKHIDPTLSLAYIGDAIRVRQILLNITGNAIKFSESGEVNINCVAIKTSKYHQEIELKITDNGIGMEDTYLKKIFTKFQQEDLSSSRKYGGSGLGLVITKELIDIMNGTIDVKSKKGVGTEITIKLTFAIGNASLIEKAETFTKSELLKEKKILLIEDNEMNRLVAINALQPYKMNIKEAENGEIAIKILEEETFDLILMDLQMPIMGGIEATQIIRKNLKINTPIIALTANAFKSEIEKCVAAGMNNYVIKPFEENELLEVISKELTAYIEINNLQSQQLNNGSNNATNTLTYNLEKLKEMSRGNNDFVTKMLTIFVETAPQSALEMQSALQISDYETIKKIAHKIKPSIDNLGVKIKDEIRLLEKINPEIDNKEQLHSMVHFVIKTITETVHSIKKNELD